MPDYNPNSIWGSKEKKYVYGPQQPAAEPAQVVLPQDAASQPAMERPLGNINQQFNGAGSGADLEQKPPSFFHRHGLLFFTIGIFLAIGITALIYYLLLPAPAPNVAISFLNPDAIVIGKPFPVVITVSNESKSVLQNATLNIMLPSGMSFASGTTPAQSLGMLSSETINPPQTIWLITTDPADEGTTQTVNTALTYQIATTSPTQFQTSANDALSIGAQSALAMTYTAPSSVFSGQDFSIAINYKNNTADALNGVQLTMQYPPAYHFVSSSGTMPSGAGNNIWDLGAIAANATGTLVITGNIVGPSQTPYKLTGTIGATFSGQNYPAFAAPIGFTVTPSPLSLTVALNNTSTYIAKLGDSLNYKLTYANNSNVTFQSVNISAALVGQMYDFKSLQTGGSFSSQNNTITWTAANTPALASLTPGQSGTVDFTISTQQAFPIKLLSDKNYSLSVTAKATSPTVPPNTAGSNTTSITALTSKIGGVITLAATGYAKETTPGITNVGTYPPKVNQPMQYTIHWDIANYSTDASSVTISAYLQSGTAFTGVATSSGIIATQMPLATAMPTATFAASTTAIASTTAPALPVPTYNAGTGLVTWTIPFIPATTGVISPSVQAVFQVSNTPAINGIGQPVTLIGPTTLTATDEYTDTVVTVTAPAVTTHLTSDPSVPADQTGEVTQ